MCGIAGILATDGAAAPTRPELERMIGSLRHRGPDGFGYHLDGPIGLAHSRLSIIDLVTGQQPLCNEDGTIWVTFNGEIFNYVELRAELQKLGHVFRTTSDTEVIVHLYEEHGDRFVDHLNGQFAIGLWDAPRRKLVLARDRVGIRPVHYAWSRGRLLFGSEIKALLAEGSLSARLDPLAVAQIFSFWSPLEDRTAFDGIHSLPPGCILVAEAGRTRVTRYWDWDFGDAESSPSRKRADYAEELRALLEDSVRLQLRADVPVGAYLSGGLDSSAVTALAHRLTGATVRTFSITFEDAEFDESGYQRQVAAALGVNSSEIRCTRADIAAGFAETIFHTESPIVRTAPVPLRLLAATVHDAGYKVVLTGEGADEVFAGYDIFREAKLRRWIARNPGSRWRGRLFGRLYPYLANSPGQARAFTERFFSQGGTAVHRGAYAHLPRISTTQRTLQFLSPELRASISDFDAPAVLEATLPPALADWPDLGRDQYVEAHTLMSGYLLSSQGDRMAMAHSVEGRFPYLDHRLIEFACRLPPQVKLFGLLEKDVLKRAVTQYVPAAVRARVKQPYRAPDSQSFFLDGRPAPIVDELLNAASLRDAGYFDPDAVGRLVAKCRAGRAIGFGDNMAFVGVLSSMAWHRQFVASTPVPRAAIATAGE